jgi:hypothetical protein
MSQTIEITPALLAELKSKAENAKTLSLDEPCESFMIYACERVLMDALSPKRVLALVAEIERLREFAKNIAKSAFQLNLYHKCGDPDECRTCRELQVARELVENHQKGGAE